MPGFLWWLSVFVVLAALAFVMATLLPPLDCLSLLEPDCTNQMKTPPE